MKSVHVRVVLEVLIPNDWSVDDLVVLNIVDPANPDKPSKIDDAVALTKAKLAEELRTLHEDIEVR